MDHCNPRTTGWNVGQGWGWRQWRTGRRRARQCKPRATRSQRAQHRSWGGWRAPPTMPTVNRRLPPTYHRNDGRLCCRRGYRICLTDILDAANKRITDLPTIPEYVANGCPFVCWAHILGCCTFNNCQFKHGNMPRSAILDSFADAVVTMLTLGVNACVAKARDQDGSTNKRQRMDGQQA